MAPTSSKPSTKSPSSHLAFPGSSSPSAGRTLRSKSPTMPLPLSSPVSSNPPSPRARPPVPRAQTYTVPFSTLSTPFSTPQASSINVAAQKRLLLPTVRPVTVRAAPLPPRVQPKASPSSKLGRSRAGSLPQAVAQPPEVSEHGQPVEWLPVGGEKFEFVEEQLELEGFQIYAVEKWVVERKRPVLVLTVYTGDPKHKITVTALSPQATLAAQEAQAVWDSAVRNLRRDGARPKETEKGTLMVTSLASFRSDYTIVHIPSGNLLDAREQLYTNIDLLRLGCGGRSALTLEEPSDATKDRFIAMYHIPDKLPSRSSVHFNATVLEIVRLLQAGLSIFGMFDVSPEERNGLLCDVTSEGVQRWLTEVGEPSLKLEPTERAADPTVIAALFSSILSTRSRLHHLGFLVPKDPFLDTLGFMKALGAFQASKPHALAHHSSTHFPPVISPQSPASSTFSLGSSAAILTPVLVESIQSAYDKVRMSESYKVHRVLKSKLDDLATDLRTDAAAPGRGSAAASTLSTTSDLGAFVKVVTSTKDAPQSLRYLWTGRAGQAELKKREKEAAVWSDNERAEERERDRDGDKDNHGRSAREREEREARSADEADMSKPWPGRVQRKIESWAALGKGKKLSVDFGTLGKAFMPEAARATSEKSGQSSVVPSVVVSREDQDEEVLSSGQQSPSSEHANPFLLGVGSIAERSASELSEYDKRVTEFNQRRPFTKPQMRISSWSDPRSAQDVSKEGSKLGASPLSKTDSSSIPDVDEAFPDEDDARPRRSLLTSGPDRRRSVSDASAFARAPVLPVERMRIDVDLCGQLLVMRRRERHLANVLACLRALGTSLAAQNARLRADHGAARGALAELDARVGELHQLEALRARAEGLTQDANALEYESAQLLVEDLWHMAAQPRRRVLALREKVFGTGRRLPAGVRGAHGQFNRVQWTLDGEERLVDRLGRTESEAEEAAGLPHIDEMELEVGEEVDAVEHQTLKPTWLLRFFNYWGGRLGLGRGASVETAPNLSDKEEAQPDGAVRSGAQSDGVVGLSSSVEMESRAQQLFRTHTVS